jgi:hypothetical protein
MSKGTNGPIAFKNCRFNFAAAGVLDLPEGHLPIPPISSNLIPITPSCERSELKFFSIPMIFFYQHIRLHVYMSTSARHPGDCN